MSKFIDMDKLILPKGTVDDIKNRGVPAILDWLVEQKSIEIVRCKDCIHSIKKDYGGVVSYGYLCVLKSSVTHLEEHEADYFCADGDRRETNG